MNHELVLEPECKDLTRLHPSTRQRLEKRGYFPKSFKIGDPNAINGRKAWSRTEIMAWLANRMAARGQRLPALPARHRTSGQASTKAGHVTAPDQAGDPGPDFVEAAK
jgi:predicted DNA-binding transcriptional regulator AlpA